MTVGGGRVKMRRAREVLGPQRSERWGTRRWVGLVGTC